MPEVKIIIEGDAKNAIQELRRLAQETKKFQQTTSAVMAQARGDTTGAIRAVARAAQEASGMWGRLAATFRGTMQVFAGLTLYDVAIHTLQGIKQLIGAGHQLNAMLETSFIAFTRSTGTMREAAKHLQELQKFAIDTAYDFGMLLEASKALQAWGYSAEEIVPIMEAVGNALAATGNFTEGYINRVVLALGQMRQKGRVYGQELRQLAEAGIPMTQALIRATGKSLVELEKMEIPVEDAIDALLRYVRESPKYANAMAQQLTTLPGRIQKIRETGDVILGYLTGPFYAAIRDFAGSVADFMDRLASNLRVAGTEAGKSFSEAFLQALSPGPLREILASWFGAFREFAETVWGLLQPAFDNARKMFSFLGEVGAPLLATLGQLTAEAFRLAQAFLALPGVSFAVDVLIARLLVLPPILTLLNNLWKRFQQTATARIGGIGLGVLLGELGVAMMQASQQFQNFTRQAGVSWAAFGQVLRQGIAAKIATLQTGARAIWQWAREVALASRTSATSFASAIVAKARAMASNAMSLNTWRAIWQRTWASISRVTLTGAVSVVGGIRWMGTVGLGLFRGFGTGLLAVARTVGRGLWSALGGIWGLLGTAMVVALPSILQNWRGFAAAFIDTAKAIWTSIKAIGQTIWYAISFQWGKIDDVWKQVGQAWVQAGRTWKPVIVKTVKDIFIGPEFELPELPKFEFPKISEPGAAAFEGFGKSVEGAGEKAKKAKEEAKQIAEDIANALSRIVSSLTSTVQEVLRSFGEGTPLAVQRIRAAFAGLLEEMRAVPQFGASLADVFKRALSLAPGLAEGSRGALASLSNIVQQVAAQIAQALQKLSKDAPNHAREGLMEARKATQDIALAIAETWEQVYERIREANQRQIEFFHRVGRISNEQYMRYIFTSLRRVKAGSEEELRLREEAYNTALEIIDAEIERVKEAWDERIRAAEEAINEEIRLREQALAALKEEDEQAKREEAAREHAEKLRKIDEELAYHRVRTGLEHQQKIKELLEQRAEEEREFLNQQAEWQREDKQEQLQREIDDLREQGRKRIEELQRQRDETLKIMENEWKQQLALAAAYSEPFFNQLKQPFEAFINWLSTEYATSIQAVLSGQTQAAVAGGLAPVAGQVEEAEEVVSGVQPSAPGEANIQYLSPNDYRIIDGTAWAWARTIGARINEPVSFDEATKRAIIGGRPFRTRMDIVPGQGWVPVREVAEAFNYIVRWLGANQPIELVPKAHTGARVLSGGLAQLLPGELVFPPGLAGKLERLIAILERWSGWAGTQVNLNGPLFQAQSVSFEDQAEMELFARSLGRAARLALAAKGGVL